MTTRPLLALGASAALVVLALGLAGCSSGGGPGPDATADWSDSPLNRYLAAVWNTDVDEDEMAADNAAVEKLVAACMKDEGFDYVPQDTTVTGSDDDWKPDDREWVEQYGYGAVDWPGRDAMQTAQPSDDPNSQYVSTLSESESTAYYEVLYGPQPTDEELAANDGMWSPTWEQQGCYGQASHEVHGDDPTQASEHKPVMDAINAFYQTMYDDPGPEMAELDAAWSDCMAAAGRTGFTKQQDAAQSIYDEQNAFYEDQTEYVADPPELDALQEEEVALALDDLDCREKTDYRRQSLAIQWAAEDQFIADHRAELDALVADAEQARADR